MTNQMKQARDEKARTYAYNNAIYIDKAMLNKEGYQYLEKKPAKDFKEGTDWYRNNMWHDVNEPPICGDSLVTTIIVKIKNKKSIFPYYLIKGTSWSNITIRDVIDKWAYMEDLLPDTNGGES